MTQRSRAQLEADNAALRRRIDELEQELKDAQARLAAAVKPPQPPPDQDLMRRVTQVLARLSAEDPHEGLVPLPALRREVGGKRGLIDRALLELERQGRLSLRPIRYPALVAAECGIDLPERGLLYYALPKAQPEQARGPGTGPNPGPRPGRA